MIPGPLSCARIMIPTRLPRRASASSISPSVAYSRMLRASSEIAVAITVWSLREKPRPAASSRPRWRADTMSAADAIRTTISPADSARGCRSLAMRTGGLRLPVEISQPLLEVEGRGDVAEGQAELDHREGDLRLDPHDDRLRSPQADHVGDGAQGPDREGVHDVEHGDVHDRGARAELAHLLRQVVAELQQVLVREGGLDRGDQVVALFEDRDAHAGTSWAAPCPRPS